jgi:hypothetical protein
MSDDEPTEPTDEAPEPAREEAYPALELDKLSESDHGERAGWRSLDEV